MNIKENSNMETICDIFDFHKIQDWLSEASNLSMITVDSMGNPITHFSNFSEHCSLVRSNNDLNNMCMKCDARGGLEAARMGEPYIYKCHMGLVDIAMPVVVDDEYFGTILVGQVVLKDEQNESQLEKIADSSHVQVTEEFAQKLKTYFDALPVMTMETIQIIASMIFKFANYFINDAHEETVRNTGQSISGESDEPDPRAKIRQIKIPECDSLILKPALDYIKENYEEKIRLDAMSDLCNISSSYFSKLFNKCLGDNFNNYINIVRMHKACNLLTNTSLPVTIIAFDIGFEDSSYFNQVFKHILGMTPTYYRAINRTRAADTL
jgi:ligand-binding sensor protein/AraC-like DNA-binding protein